MKVQVNKLTEKAKAGFSLVELLVVIAVIGIMAAIAIPIISNINQNAVNAVNRRNAQNIANVYGAAVAAGATIDTGSVSTVINDLQTGKTGIGQFSSTTFKVNISDAEQTTLEAAGHLSIADGVLNYSG
ncbi:MAG: prepilin-type N-terminal cleavage/methylation domain-containing protein [Verrucomicrobiales bacterium]